MVTLCQGSDADSSSAPSMVTPPPRSPDCPYECVVCQVLHILLDCFILGKLELSPKSEAKRRKEHYVVMDPFYKYLCVLCGNSADHERDIRRKKCFALPSTDEARDRAEPIKPQQKQIEMEEQTFEQLQLEELALLEEEEQALQQLLELERLEKLEKELLQQEATLGMTEEEALAAALKLSREEALASGDEGSQSDSRASSSWENPKAVAAEVPQEPPQVTQVEVPQEPPKVIQAEVPPEPEVIQAEVPQEPPKVNQAEVPQETKVLQAEVPQEPPQVTQAEVPQEPKVNAAEVPQEPPQVIQAEVLQEPEVPQETKVFAAEVCQEVVASESECSLVSLAEGPSNSMPEDLELLSAKAFPKHAPEQKLVKAAEALAADILAKPLLRTNTPGISTQLHGTVLVDYGCFYMP